MAAANINALDDKGSTKLFTAILDRNLAEVDRLLKAGADINKGVPRTGFTPLFYATQKGYTEIVERILKDPRIDVNKEIRAKVTPLFIACQKGFVDIVNLLLASPAIDINKPGLHGASSLYIATINNQLEVIKILVADPRTDVNQTGHQHIAPLYIAAHNESIAIVDVLLTAPHIDVNLADDLGRTPLFIAAFNGKYKSVERLLADPRVDISRKSEAGKVAVDIARKHGYMAIAELIESVQYPYVEPDPIDLEYEHDNVPLASDLVELTEEKITNIDGAVYIIFKSGKSYFYYKREDIDITDKANWVLECKEAWDLKRGPLMRDPIAEDTIYYNLRGLMNYLIPIRELRSALASRRTYIFELLKVKELPFTASYNAIVAQRPYIGYNGVPKEAEYLVSAYHCQEGSSGTLFRLQPLSLLGVIGGEAGAGQGGGRRKTRRRRGRGKRRITRARPTSG